MSTAGALDTLHFVDDSAVEQLLDTGEIEIEIKAIGLNFRDGMAAKSSVPLSSGSIEASESGDRVAVFTKGAFATKARTRECLAFKIPKEISFEAAASLPLA
ncbi:hypothetical protein MYCTH_2128242 [Thermothelomyces thermophilus ATCC 42464]|uniref:Uncharacterized protein n=1 Tax=Thermothelomyces thermophilus (strain ATCC 42464 / BCRC 31852 / DSM 1799) TaxID=573729 RepID=G2QFF5_THET4|nr:uncharacterized protein MYCTH_2128242 [Thermothelomyces thermophilus ATCC 42464]AEO59184.1 hypothetical protein MYCTH_2128242 [Thermothelomyces thermophilus ATCC 42464]